MDLPTLAAILGSAFAIIATMVSLFLWLRSEANADRRNINEIQREDRKDLLHMCQNIDENQKEDRKEFLQISRNIENMVLSIQNEMKDFHGRLERQDAEFKAHLLHLHQKG